MADKKKNMLVDFSNIDKKKALEVALADIEKNYGKGAIMKLGERPRLNIESIPTGAIGLDIALGVGGLPRGRIIEIFGPEASGKTTVALHAIAEAQKLGGDAAFIDAEHALDPQYAKKLGVNIDELFISQPDTGEQALEITEALVRSGAIDIVVVDSVAALVPRAEIDGEMGDSHMGLQARLMSQALRKLAGVINKSNTIAIFINQLREKVGITFGNPETTPGGRALKFYASVRLDVRRVEAIKSGTEMLGNKTKIKIVKNKVAPPFKEVEVDIVYGKGISREGNILDVAVGLDIINRSGSWFSYNGQRIGQGRDNVKQFLIENPDICNEIESEIRANYEPAEDRRVEIVQQREAVIAREAGRAAGSTNAPDTDAGNAANAANADDMAGEIDILTDFDD
ncbi:MAG: recombinase RecA [Oscillospiraceae bacterium]|nr:recombinase RecA [Oscillospiraceae bacterium]